MRPPSGQFTIRSPYVRVYNSTRLHPTEKLQSLTLTAVRNLKSRVLCYIIRGYFSPQILVKKELAASSMLHEAKVAYYAFDVAGRFLILLFMPLLWLR